MTSFAPDCLAARGKPAAGSTTSDEPIARKRLARVLKSNASSSTLAGRACPNDTVACFMRSLPQAGQGGTESAAKNFATIPPDS
ncbi:MAG TPA: hypothetical protein VGX78_15680 [Pirellulales bacterium]|nr:hypothetical protein [Pirellulales bacterium]